MHASLADIRLSRSALRFVVIASSTMATLALLLCFEPDSDRWLLLAHNPLRDNPAIIALGGALSRFGMSAICLLVLACTAASFRFPAFFGVRTVLLVVLFSSAPPRWPARSSKSFWAGRAPLAILA